MAKNMERAVRRERVYTEMVLQAFSAGWEAAMESLESEEALYWTGAQGGGDITTWGSPFLLRHPQDGHSWQCAPLPVHPATPSLCSFGQTTACFALFLLPNTCGPPLRRRQLWRSGLGSDAIEEGQGVA